MKITFDWLKDHLTTNLKEEKLLAQLTNVGLEVESVENLSEGLDLFKIAKIIKTSKHPNADRLKVCEVDVGEKEFKKVENIKTILGTEKTVELPKSSVDKILMVDVYHEFSFPVEMINSIKNALKPNGELFLIEYRAEDLKVPIKRIHKMTEEQAVKEMKAAGLVLKENIDNLPWQHCMVFIKNN